MKIEISEVEISGHKFRLTVDKTRKANYKPAMALAHEGMAQLFAEGYDSGGTVLSHDQNSIYLEKLFDNGTSSPAAVMVYSESGWEDMLYINMTYVKPAYRRIGLCTFMWNKILEIAAADKVHGIYTGTHHTNTVMQKVMEKRGMTKRTITYTIEVPRPAKIEEKEVETKEEHF